MPALRRTDVKCEPAKAAGEHLVALRGELEKLGLRSVVKTGGVWPCLRMDGRGDDFDNTVVAVYIGGRWRFFWPWFEIIGPACDPAGAAAVIAEEFGHDGSAMGTCPKSIRDRAGRWR